MLVAYNMINMIMVHMWTKQS